MSLPIRRFLPSSLPSSLAFRFVLVTLGALNGCAAGPASSGAGANGAEAPGGAAPGDGRACTEMGCVEGLTIDLQSPSGWAPGAYRFDIELDQDKVSCEVTLPLRACDAGPSARCTLHPGEGPSERVMISESGCALPPAQHSLPTLSIRGEPARVRVAVSRDGAQLASEELTPAYRTVTPNGPGCEPVCRQAHGAVTLR